MNERGMLSSKEAAKYLGLSPKTLANWRSARQGPPFHRLGNGPRPRIAYRESDLQAWIDDHLVVWG